VDYHASATLLRRQGHRITPQRLLILDVVASALSHRTAEEIHTEVVKRQPFIDIATVYRTLQWLRDVGLVTTMVGNDGKQRYEYRPAGEAHHHLVCRDCGHELQIPDDDLAPLRSAMRHHYGFQVDDAHIALMGHCGDCLSARTPSAS
jgi:Fur family ferric uptake transcriptional regulator